MKSCVILALTSLVLSSLASGVEVTKIRAVHRHGQTFITWKDAAEGEAGEKFRYSVYRADEPISADNLERATLLYDGLLYNSGRLFGTAFNHKDRIDSTKPYAILAEGGEALPPGSGLAVHTAQRAGRAFYAIVATDEKLAPQSTIVPGESATTEAVEDIVAPIQPIKLFDSKARGIYTPQTSITGKKGLPLRVDLHASQAQGGTAGDYGDYYLYFATPAMGYRDGLPGVFSVEERRESTGNYLLLRIRECIEHPTGVQAMETFWFGYLCVPQNATHREPRAYPFTEVRTDWIIDWVIAKYAADPQRVTAGGGSMGAWGSTTYAFRQPHRFAAVYPDRPRIRQRGLPRLASETPEAPLMSDGKTPYFDRMDMAKFASEHHGDLPFYAWGCGRHDGFATWQEQVDMVKALTVARHGFAFAWNNGDHSSGSQAMANIRKYYSPEHFARDKSYPAFGHSSIDQQLGSGDPKDGDLEGGINLGFRWAEVIDEADRWSVRLANDLAKGAMTVDVTPRRCQQFKLKPGSTVQWSTDDGAKGSIVVDDYGLATIEQIKLRPETQTLLTLRSQE